MRTFGKMILAFGAVALMAAPAWAQGQGRGGFGMGGGMLLTNKGVQKELKVTDEQATKLGTLATELREKNQGRFQGLQDLSDDERRTKMQELQKTMQAELHKSLADILKPEQVKRFDEISLQQAGANAFSTPRVVEALKLTDDQKTKIQEINQATMESMRGLRDEFQNDREGAMKKMAEVRKGASDKVTALLTDDQKKSWKDLTGDPYEVKFEPRPNN